MSDTTTIEWTDRTWNPITGCTKVSPGCDHCYAETIAERFRGGPAFPNGFDVQLREHKLNEPLRWRKPAKVFVNSMSDLFHDAVSDEYIQLVWDVMRRCPQHTFQILTKRHARMRSLLNRSSFYGHDWPRPLPNVWLGVSTEDQKWANLRIPSLLNTPAAVRFVSAEPLIGRIDLGAYTQCQPGLDWVIVGGESGPSARSVDLHWVQEIRDQCVSARVPFLFKQWGEWAPDHDETDPSLGHQMRRMGKKRAGRELDGRTWDEYPVCV